MMVVYPSSESRFRILGMSKGVIDRGRGAFGHGDQPGAVVADSPVPCLRLAEGVPVDVRGGQPHQIAADLGGVGAPGGGGQRRPGKRRGVADRGRWVARGAGFSEATPGEFTAENECSRKSLTCGSSP